MSDEEKMPEEQATPEEALATVADIKAAVEAILFAAGYPIRYDKLAEVLGLGERDVKLLIEEMQPAFNADESERGLRLLMLPETAQLCTKERFMPYIREALGIRRGGNLSASSLETLAVVAYNQPVTRAFVDQVRGVDSSYAMNSLVDKALIEACGRLDAPGRPMLYATTDKFLRVFGFNSLDDLPATEPLVTPDKAGEAEGAAGETEAAESDTGDEQIEEAEEVEKTEQIEEIERIETDDDIKIAEGRIDIPEKPEAEIDLTPSDDELFAEETGGEIENSTGN